MPRHARLEMQAAAVPAFDLPILVLDERARPDQAHLAPEDVEQLGELVERAAPQQLADARDPRIVSDLEQAVGGFVLPAQLVALRLRADVHRAELEHLEHLAVAADAAAGGTGRDRAS